MGNDEAELVKGTVQNASIRLNRVPLIDVKYPTGLKSRVEYVLTLLSNTTSKDVLFLGIWGLGGIGKTTIVTTVYNRICGKFSKSCFLNDIGDTASQPNGIDCLQQKLLCSVFNNEMKICNPKQGSTLIKERLGKIDILLILDDVSHHTQLDALAGDINWFGTRSRITITTRDQGTLCRIPENDRKVYEPKELNMKESLQLFSSYAFSMNKLPENYLQLSNDIIHTTRGLPLALGVLGSYLSMEKDKKVWQSMHQILKQVPQNDVYGKLRISYDNLQDNIEKAMFLNAACCFIGYKEEIVISIWEACGYEPRYHLEALKKKSLLKINEQKVHIELPTNFYHEEIVMLDLSHGYFKLAWNNCLENKVFQQLKVLKLSNCVKLFESPNFSGFPRLERLYLDGCALVNLHESIGKLQQLVYLNLGLCISLKKLLDSICRLSSLQKLILNHCILFTELPKSIGDLKESLVEFLLDYTNIKALPDGVGLLKKLEVLDLSHCFSLVDLPRSLENMTYLHYILLSGRTKLRYIPKLPSSLIELRF
ncbi:disease resistance protein Roq1-like [Macadamia integrifolia]|uniref:disease resistance protein Roq1-like n=1 Tax=Macadamia integrifolia TaxID=60698 RepID=UPI001C52F50A|nr:disease resistance protein Roq1-like [Macadamia integrifolia]